MLNFMENTTEGNGIKKLVDGIEIDGLKIRIIEDMLNYDKAEVYIYFENLIGKRFHYKLSFEKIGVYYVSRTKLIE